MRLTLPIARDDVTASHAPLVKIFDSADANPASPTTIPRTPTIASPIPDAKRLRLDAKVSMSDVRVLLVEDDVISMRILSTVCHREGVDFQEAIDGFQAVGPCPLPLRAR